MTKKRKQTFEEALQLASPGNVEVLERKAHIATLLAQSYPEHRNILRTIETKALEQIFKILTYTVNSHGVSLACPPTDGAPRSLKCETRLRRVVKRRKILELLPESFEALERGKVCRKHRKIEERYETR